jgi:uncharacterized BrkB/YihY/UPF0761 family membrane protein
MPAAADRGPNRPSYRSICTISACAAVAAGEPGALVAAVPWLIGSVAFSIHLQNVGSYNETGSPGTVLILLMWFWLPAFIVLLGAS